MKKHLLYLFLCVVALFYSCKKENISNSSLKFVDQAVSYLKPKMATDDFQILNWQKAKVEFINGEPVLIKIPSIRDQNIVLLYAASEGKEFVNWVEYDLYQKDELNYGSLKLKSLDNNLLNSFEINGNQIRKVDNDNISLFSNDVSMSVDNDYKELPEIVVTAYRNNNLSNFWSLYWLFNMDDYWSNLYTSDSNLFVSTTGGGGNSDYEDSENELYNPLFKFPLNNNYAKLYPKFTKLIKTGLLKLVSDNQNIVESISKLTHLSKVEICNNLKWGNGPEIIVQIMKKENGQVLIGKWRPENPNSLLINLDDVLDFEAGKGLDSEAMSFLLAITIFHEYVHYGDYKYD